ncbi:methanol dehydrogenase regulatory protein [Kalymmatonema gypsitolerans NIES-4073]|nr:methanol dehydrogenase regulatory protein [Scytonema sp. NIES-4073]
MEEQQVTVDGVSRDVPTPFFVIATQNPIEYQGTFPLPEAQMDRFMLSLSLGYPTQAEELQMLQRHQKLGSFEQTGFLRSDSQPGISLIEVQELRGICDQVKLDTFLQQYILDLVRATRQDEEITLGVSPRGTLALQRATQALAFLLGRDYAIPDDVKFLAPHVLCHRLILTGGRRARTVIERLLRAVPIP